MCQCMKEWGSGCVVIVSVYCDMWECVHLLLNKHLYLHESL